MKKETRVFEITASSLLIKRIERFLAFLHFNSHFGHSGLFAMSLDGDGCEKVEIKGLDKRLSHEVDAIGGVGYDIEIARDTKYSGAFIDSSKESKWYTGPSVNLYRDGDIVKTLPICDWKHPKHQTDA